MRNVFALLAAAALVLALGHGPAALAATPLPGEVAVHSPTLETVTYKLALDGDTVEVTHPGDPPHTKPEHVRLFAINAPELHSGKSAAFAAALRVSTELEQAQAVYLERDPAALTDKYGRSLAWVWYRTSDGRLINLSVEEFQTGAAPLFRGTIQSHFYDQALGISVSTPAGVRAGP